MAEWGGSRSRVRAMRDRQEFMSTEEDDDKMEGVFTVLDLVTTQFMKPSLLFVVRMSRVLGWFCLILIMRSEL